MKKIFGLLMILVVGSITQASDNRSAPNVFSSGSTISSSQMNENFNFLASEIREKDVYCDNGDTISDAINAGYNSLTIFGACDGGVVAYMFDPVIYGVSFNQMLNKPVSHLIIKGGEANRAAVIKNTAALMESGAMQKSFLELSNLTFNDSLNANAGSVILLNEVNYEVTNIINVSNGDDPEYGRLTSYDNSFIDIKDSSITAEIKANDGSVINIENTTVNPTEQKYRVLNINRNSVLKTERSTLNAQIRFSNNSIWYDYKSTVNCTTDWSCVGFTSNSNINIEDTIFNLVSNSGSAFYGDASYVNFYTPVVDCTSEYSCFDFNSSNFNLDLSNNFEGPFEVSSANSSAFNFKNTTTYLKNGQINCTSRYSCINLENSNLRTDSISLDIISAENAISGYNNSYVKLNNSNYSCPTGSGWPSCINVSYNSVVQVSDTEIQTVNSNGLEAQWNSNIQINNYLINRSDQGSQIHLNAHSNLQIQAGTQDLSIDCGSQTFIQNQTSVIISGACSEY